MEIFRLLIIWAGAFRMGVLRVAVFLEPIYIYLYFLNIFSFQYPSFQDYYLVIDAFRTF